MKEYIKLIFVFTLGFMVCVLLTYNSKPPKLYVLNLSELLSRESERVLKEKDERGMFYGRKDTPNLLSAVIKQLEAKYKTKVYEIDNAEEVIDVTDEIHELLLETVKKKPATVKEAAAEQIEKAENAEKEEEEK